MRKLKIVSDSSSDLLKLDNADFDFSPMILSASQSRALYPVPTIQPV